MLTLRALPVGGPPPGGLPAPCAGCGVREWRGNLCREGCPRPGPHSLHHSVGAGAGGGGGFRPSRPSPRPSHLTHTSSVAPALVPLLRL